jgi:predicted phosphodiesterase
MKIALVTDTHFCVHRSSEIFLNSQLSFFKDQFFPDLKKRGIDTIIHLGDFFDNRVFINVRIQNIIYNMMMNEGKDFKWYILVGNHCSYYKTNIETNSLKQFEHIEHIDIINEIKKINLDGRDILLVPWQIDNNDFQKRVSNKNITCDVCMGHFETRGFLLNKGKVCDEGIDSEIFFNNFKVVFSGHFHKRTLKKRNESKIQYIGNAYHLTRHDIGEDRGYTIFDTNTLEYEFINNEKSLKFVNMIFPEKIIKDKIRGNIVDVCVDVSDEKYDEIKFREYMTKIEKCNPITTPNVKIENNFQQNVEIDYKVQTVNELIEEYVSKLNISNKKEVIEKIIELYQECKTIV